MNQYGQKLGYVSFAMITDGLSNTILAGDKHVLTGYFGCGVLDCSLYNGDYWMCSSRSIGPNYPLAQKFNDSVIGFGGYHFGICEFLMGDGSVRAIATTPIPTSSPCWPTSPTGSPLRIFERSAYRVLGG